MGYAINCYIPWNHNQSPLGYEPPFLSSALCAELSSLMLRPTDCVLDCPDSRIEVGQLL